MGIVMGDVGGEVVLVGGDVGLGWRLQKEGMKMGGGTEDGRGSFQLQLEVIWTFEYEQ